jgi:hypothetical protein
MYIYNKKDKKRSFLQKKDSFQKIYVSDKKLQFIKLLFLIINSHILSLSCLSKPLQNVNINSYKQAGAERFQAQLS